MRKAFADLMGVHENEVDERDLPVVAIAGSGGGESPGSHSDRLFVTQISVAGFRAMVNTTGSLIGAKKFGLLDCITYISGISGKSCSNWAE